MSKNAMKQEFFEINDSSLIRRKVIRQDRLDLEEGKGSIEINSTKFEVLNVTAFGFAALVKERDLDWFMNLNDQINAEFKFCDTNFQTIHFRPVRKEQHPNSIFNDWIVGCELIGEPLEVDRLQAVQATLEMIREQQTYTQKNEEVPPAFKALVFEVKDWLMQLKDRVDKLTESLPTNSFKEEKVFKTAVIDTIGAYLSQVIPNIYNRIPEILNTCTSEQKEKATAFIREQVGPMIYGAPFANRAYFKPRGYAGDYEMMNHLYRDEGAGKSLFDQCLQRYFIDEPAGQAVKNRGYYLLSKIENLTKRTPNAKKFRVVSIASGPAMEVQLFLEKRNFKENCQYEFHFIDQDEESLKHAQRQIHSIERFVKSGFEFNFHNLAIKNIIGKGIPHGKFDLVYSAGLFDYFTEPVATAAASKFLDATNDSGQVVIGNFSKDNPSTLIMEYFLDWYLIYRSPEDLHRIFSPAGKVVTVEKEPLGINLFAVLEKK